MSKERVIAFTDAILAIIMTILVLELKEPDPLNLAGLWSLKASYFAYMLSFFWIGTMWVGLHNEWQDVDKISTKVIWATLLLLFSSSLFPYTTKIVSFHYSNELAQAMYGIVVLLTTCCNLWLSKVIAELHATKTSLQGKFAFKKRWLKLDILVKLLGLLLTITVYPPAMMISVLVSSIFIALPSHAKEKTAS